jgi:hypothetical protein
MIHVGGREAVEGLEHMEVGFAALRADQRGRQRITRAQPRVEIDEFLCGSTATPCQPRSEEERHVVRDRMAGADVDVGTCVPAAERARDACLHVLCVGKIHGYSRTVVPAKYQSLTGCVVHPVKADRSSGKAMILQTKVFPHRQAKNWVCLRRVI